MKAQYLKKILNARVYDVAIQSPLQTANRLSKRLDNTLWLKREDLQQIFCYKLRGAFNKMSRLSQSELDKGVVAASAGNHAQGVALAAQKLDCKAVIFMPTTTPEIKKESVENLGGLVRLVGDSYSDASTAAHEYCESHGMTYIPPFDDPDIIAGQGTVAAEIIRQTQHKLDAIFIPVGGGGLISGMAAFIKAVRPEIKIIGVEPDDSDAMAQSITAGERLILENVGIFADGVAVKQVGEETFRLCQQYVDEFMVVSTDELCAAILFVLGALWGTLWGQSILDKSLPDELIKKDVWAIGTVQDLPRQQARALRFKFYIESLEYESQLYTYSGDVLINWYKPFPVLKAGQRWRLRLRLKPAFGSLNPGGFNYAQWLFSQGVRATGYVRETQAAVLLEPARSIHRFSQLRGRVERFIKIQGMEYGGLLNALAVGVRTGISDHQWQVFRDTGTAHLMAISGLHIGMVAAMAYFLGAWLWRHSLLVRTQYPTQKIARLAAILAALAYAALAGFSLPTLRALLMLLAYFSLQFLRRNPDTLFSLGFVLLVVLLFDPLAPLGSGLWLSFSAVGAIALVVRSEPITIGEPVIGVVSVSYVEKLNRWFRQWWRVQWAVFIGLLPLTLFFFQQVSLLSLLANFVAIPVIASLVVPLILLALVCFFLGLSAISAQVLSLADTLLGWLWPLLDWLSALPFSIWRLAAPPVWVVLLCSVGAIILLRPALGRARVLGVLGFLPLFIVSSPAWEAGAFRLHVLDVGQGLAVVVETQHHALLYDAGVKYASGFDVGSAIIVPFLRQQRIASLNTVVASHDNLDHVGGMDSVLAAYRATRRYSSAGFYRGSEPCTAGIHWQWDGVRFSFLHPVSGNEGTDNNDSCVLKIESRFGSTLLTGDIEREAELSLLKLAKGDLNDIDVLLVPHHGSKTSSTEEFIQSVNPALAIVSAGYLNRFKHPHPQVVKRYITQNIRVLNTASSGWIKVDFDKQGVQATPWRSLYKRYWLEKVRN